MGLRLHNRIYDRLKESAVGVSEEIRNRLLESIARDDCSKHNRELGDKIAALATIVDRHTGQQWNAHPATAALLIKVIEVLIKRSSPEGEPVFESFPPSSSLNRSDTLDAMARQVALAAEMMEEIEERDKKNRYLRAYVAEDEKREGLDE